MAVGHDSDDDQPDVLATIKTDPGNVSLDSLLEEIAKLKAVRAVGLPGGLFADVGTGGHCLAGPGRGRVAQPPARSPPPTRLVLLPRCCSNAQREITDTLVELLISTVHRINARAEQKVIKAFVADSAG